MKSRIVSGIAIASCMLAVASCHAGEPAAAIRTDAASATPPLQQSRVVIPPTPVDGIPVHELSGLAWDADDQRLYAVSDKGNLFQFRLQRDGDQLTAVEPLHAAALVDESDARRKFNAEGLAIRNASNGKKGDSQLLVALEGGNQPRLLRVGTNGKVLGSQAVASPLNDYANYQNPKHGLESVALDAKLGALTAAESPLSSSSDLHTIRAKDGHWSFRMIAPDSRLKGLDVMPDGKLLVLERAEMDPNSKTRTAILRLLDPTRCDAQRVCQTRTVAVLPSGSDNFEGITCLDSSHLLVVSDDKGGKRGLKTVLVLLTIVGV